MKQLSKIILHEKKVFIPNYLTNKLPHWIQQKPGWLQMLVIDLTKRFYFDSFSRHINQTTSNEYSFEQLLENLNGVKDIKSAAKILRKYSGGKNKFSCKLKPHIAKQLKANVPIVIIESGSLLSAVFGTEEHRITRPYIAESFQYNRNPPQGLIILNKTTLASLNKNLIPLMVTHEYHHVLQGDFTFNNFQLPHFLDMLFREGLTQYLAILDTDPTILNIPIKQQNIPYMSYVKVWNAVSNILPRSTLQKMHKTGDTSPFVEQILKPWPHCTELFLNIEKEDESTAAVLSNRFEIINSFMHLELPPFGKFYELVTTFICELLTHHNKEYAIARSIMFIGAYQEALTNKRQYSTEVEHAGKAKLRSLAHCFNDQKLVNDVMTNGL